MENKIKLMILWLLILINGCQAIPTKSARPPDVTASPVPVSPSQLIMTPSSPTPASPGLQTLIQGTKEDLSARLAIPADRISLVEITDAEWSDSSLDCPQPGMSYLQVITPGFRVLLQAGSQVYEYHTNRDSHFVYCENQLPPALPKP